jgi:hypothetical protein
MSTTAANMAPSDARRCPKCRAELRAGTIRCWLCEAEVQPVAADSAAAPPAAGQSKPAERVGTYSLASLMMFVTLVAVVCGTFTIAPGLGFLVAIVAALAFVRTVILVHRQSALAHHPSAVERVVVFCGSLAVIIVTGVAAAAAFYATCVGGFLTGIAAGNLTDSRGYGWLGGSLVVGVVLGIVAALYVAYRVFILLSKRQRGIRLSRRNKLVLAGAFVLALVVIIWLYLHNWRWDDLL